MDATYIFLLAFGYLLCFYILCKSTIWFYRLISPDFNKFMIEEKLKKKEGK